MHLAGDPRMPTLYCRTLEYLCARLASAWVALRKLSVPLLLSCDTCADQGMLWDHEQAPTTIPWPACR